MKIILLAILNSLFMVIGQILWKTGISGKDIKSPFEIFQAMFSPFILGGILVYIIATFLWLYILNKSELSYIYPVQSLAYVFSLLPAIFIFGENVYPNRLIGAVIICFGVYMVTIK